MAFLGKISAVVTANTTDFTKKIEGTSKQVLDLKRKLSGFQLNLNTRSLDGTLTQLQKFNRTLQEAAKLSASVRLANGFPDLKRLADQFRAFEDIGKPLTKVKNEIEGLANSVQSRLYPELEKVQKGFQRLYNEIDAGTATFDGSRKQVEGLTAALTRLSRVSAAAKDIGGLAANLNSSNTGASFFQPGAKAALQRSLELRGRAEQLPARVRGGVFAELAVEAEANAQRVEEQAARVSAAILEIQRSGQTPGRLDALAREQEALDRLSRRQEFINNQFAKEIRSSEIRQVISPEAEPQVERLKAKFEQLASDLRSINASKFDGVISSVGTLVEQLNRGEVSAKKVKAALDGLATVKTASIAVSGAGEAADRALTTQRERDERAVREAAEFQRRQIRQQTAMRFGQLNQQAIEIDDNPARRTPAVRFSAKDYFPLLDYSDVTGRSVAPSENAKKYAKELSKKDFFEVERLSGFLRDQFDKAMASIGLSPSASGRSQSWSVWDIGKQLFLSKNPSQSSSRYRLANPFSDEQLRREMVQRMVGYEIFAQSGAGGKPPSSADLTAAGAKALEDAGFAFGKLPARRDPVADQRRVRERIESASGRLLSNRSSRIDRVTVGESLGLERIAFAQDIAERTRAIADRPEVAADPRLGKQADAARQRSIALAGDLKRIQGLFDAGDTTAARASLKAYGEQADAQVASLNRLEKAINGVSAAQERLNKFLRESGSRSTKLGETFERNAADISLLRNLVGNFDPRAERAGGGDAAKRAIQRAVEENEKLIRLEGRVLAQQRRPGESQDSFEQKQSRRLDIIQRAAVRERDSLANQISEASFAGGGRGLPPDQIKSILDRNAKNQGSFGARSAAVVQLAAQQGLFAIDDLISSTGGLEYKLRAIGNNITQLGLLLGQSGVIPGLSATAGLAAGLAVVIGGQLASALLRWVTGAKKAEEAAQALNKSISLQKNLFDQISQGFQSIGGDIATKGFSEAAASANQFSRALETLIKQQRQLRTESLLVAGSEQLSTGVTPTRSTVLSGRAALERIDERLRTADRPGETIALQRQRAEIARAEFRAAQAAAGEQSPSGDVVRQAIQAAASRLGAASNPRGIAGTADAIASGDFRLGPLLGFGGSAGGLVLRAASTQAQRLAAGLPLGQSREDRQAQISALDDIIERLKAVPTQEALGSQTTASNAAEQTVRELERLQVLLRSELGLIDFLREASKASKDLAAAQRIASAALDDSVPGALALRERLDGYANEIQAANTAIAEANQRLSNNQISPEERNAEVDRQLGIIRGSSAARQRAIREADPLAFSSIVNPGRLLRNRISDASQRLSAAGFGDSEISRRLRVIEAERQQASRFLESRRGPDGRIDAGSQRIFEGWNAELNRQAAELQVATRAVESFAEVLNRAQREAEGNFESARGRADQARRDQLGFDSPRTRLERDISASDEERARALRNEAQNAIDVERARLAQQALGGAGPLADVFGRLEQIGQRLSEGGLTLSEREGLIRERRSLQDQVDAEVMRSDEVRARVDASTGEDERQQAARRGRQLFQRPADRLGEEVARGISDIGQEIARRRDQAERDFIGPGNFDPAGFQAELAKITQQGAETASRFVGEKARSAAPAIFNLADSVANALLQGPSRAALNVTDVSSVDGQRELNRLLRGDDPARDVNLVELQKQSQSLEKLVQAAEEEAKARGIVLDWK